MDIRVTTIKLGEGLSSTVFLGSFNGTPCAIKKISSIYFARFPNRRARLVNESAIHTELDHENIVKMFGFNIPDKTALYFILEWMELGDLHDLLYKFKITFNSEQCLLITNDIANGLNYIHKHHFLHRDIKPKNILFNQKMQAKITDFGYSIRFEDKNLAVIAGTPLYFSPEIAPFMLNNTLQCEYETWTDIYAFGITLLTILCAPNYAYNFKNLDQLYRMIINRQYRQPPPETIEPLKNIILNCLIKDPKERITTQTILESLSTDASITSPDAIRTALQLKVANSGHEFFHHAQESSPTNSIKLDLVSP